MTCRRPGESVACVVDKNSVESLVQVIYEISFKGYGRGYSILLLLNVSVVVTLLFWWPSSIWVGGKPYARVARGRTFCSKPSARWHLPGNFILLYNKNTQSQIFWSYIWLFLHWSCEKVGKLVSVDDEDQARVSFFADSPAVNPDSPESSFQPGSSSTVLTLPLDRLCKVAISWPGFLTIEFWIKCFQLVELLNMLKTLINPKILVWPRKELQMQKVWRIW